MQESVDVAIIGAGIAGCHLAQALASHDISTALIDQKSIDKAGPHWINAVPAWMFDASGLPLPQGDELFDRNDRFIIRAPNKKNRLVINDLGMLDVHMKLLGNRLKHGFSQQASAHVVEASIKRGYFSHDRLMEIGGETKDGKSVVIKARLFVDASGLKATLRKNHPHAQRLWPIIHPADTCTAAQVTFFIKDRHGAQTYLEKQHVQPGDVLSDVGFMGGYSLFRSQIDHNLNHISILCGVRAVPEYDSALTVVDKFVQKNPWIHQSFIEGRGVIPINGPYHQLIAPGLALLGDAACQVYSAHGSGIGIGLIAAKILADTIIEAHDADLDIGSLPALAKYPRVFHKKYYKRLYFSEHFRKFSQDLDDTQMIKLLKSGVLSDQLAQQTLMQMDPHLPRSSIGPFLASALKSPRIFASMIPVLTKAIGGSIHARRLGETVRTE